MQSPVRLAIIGTGGISHAHANGLLQHRQQIVCTTVCDISAESRARLIAKLGSAPVQFADWREMMSQGGDQFDAVLICLPHHLHAPAIMEACRAGKHILCEKPMCTSLAEADLIADAVQKAGVIYMSAHNQLFLPFFREFRRMIAAGAIGTPYWIQSQDCFRHRADFTGQWRANAKLQGGGELIDTGYHPTYRLLDLVSAPTRAVRATMGRFFKNIEGEDTASVQIRFANGVIGQVLTSWAMAQPWGTHQMHAIGDQGQLFGSGQDLYYLPEGFSEPAKFRVHGESDTFVAQMACFARCLLAGERPPHSVAEGRSVLEVILQATESAAGWEDTAPVKMSR